MRRRHLRRRRRQSRWPARAAWPARRRRGAGRRAARRAPRLARLARFGAARLPRVRRVPAAQRTWLLGWGVVAGGAVASHSRVESGRVRIARPPRDVRCALAAARARFSTFWPAPGTRDSPLAAARAPPDLPALPRRAPFAAAAAACTADPRELAMLRWLLCRLLCLNVHGLRSPWRLYAAASCCADAAGAAPAARHVRCSPQIGARARRACGSDVRQARASRAAASAALASKSALALQCAAACCMLSG